MLSGCTRLVYVLAMVGFVASTGAVTAQERTGGVDVGGDVKINVQADNVITTAISDSKANAEVGTVSGNVKVGGDVDISVNADNVITTAIDDSEACAKVGTVTSAPCK